MTGGSKPLILYFEIVCDEDLKRFVERVGDRFLVVVKAEDDSVGVAEPLVFEFVVSGFAGVRLSFEFERSLLHGDVQLLYQLLGGADESDLCLYFREDLDLEVEFLVLDDMHLGGQTVDEPREGLPLDVRVQFLHDFVLGLDLDFLSGNELENLVQVLEVEAT